MKKLIGTVAAAALLASAAFAELSMGAWIRTVVAPVASDGEDIVAGWSNSWGYGIRNARISFNWTSEDEKVGMMYDLFGDGAGGFGGGDYRAGWYKPAEWVKLMVGHIDNGYTMRSDLCLPSWGWLRPNNWMEGDEGLTFNLGNADALQIEFFPVEGLQILGRLAMPSDGGFTDAYKVFERSSFAVGYTIGNIGTIKAAWNGRGAREYKNKDDVHGAGWGYAYKDKDGKKHWSYMTQQEYQSMYDNAYYEESFKDHMAKSGVKNGTSWFDDPDDFVGNFVDDWSYVYGKNYEKLNDTQKKVVDAFKKWADANKEYFIASEADSDDVKASDGDYSKETGYYKVKDEWGDKWYEEVKLSGEVKYYGDIQAAFDLTAVENLFITVGVRISLASDDFKKLGGANFSFPGSLGKDEDPTIFNTFKGALGASYQITDSIKVGASYAIFLLEEKGEKLDPAHQFGVGVDIGLTDALALGVDFRGMLPGNDIDPIFSFTVGFDYNFSGNGMFGIGFQGVIAGENAPAASSGDTEPARTASVFPARPDKFSWAVPIRFSYWF